MQQMGKLRLRAGRRLVTEPPAHGFLLTAMVTMLTGGWLGTVPPLRAGHALFCLILIASPPGPTLQQSKQACGGNDLPEATCICPRGLGG